MRVKIQIKPLVTLEMLAKSDDDLLNLRLILKNLIEYRLFSDGGVSSQQFHEFIRECPENEKASVAVNLFCCLVELGQNLELALYLANKLDPIDEKLIDDNYQG